MSHLVDLCLWVKIKVSVGSNSPLSDFQFS